MGRQQLTEPDGLAAVDSAGSRGGGFLPVCVLLIGVGGLALAWGCGALLPIQPGADLTHRHTAAFLGLAFLVSGLAGVALWRRIGSPIQMAMVQTAQRVDALRGRTRAWDLVLVSMLGLFLEVLLIRWHASELRAAAYFKNVTLLASFLGLGLGFAAANRNRLSLLIAPVVLTAQVIVLAVMGLRDSDAVLRLPTAREWIWGVSQAQWDWSSPATYQPRYWLQAGVFYGFYAALFISTILIFVPIGQMTGRLMRSLTPIRAYTLNILGSLAGVILFGVVSYLWWPPPTWFAIAAVLLVYALRHERIGASLGAACLVVLLAVVGGRDSAADTHSVYSPYQRLEIQRAYLTAADGKQLETGAYIHANRAYHLRVINVGSEFVAANAERYPRLREVAAAYDLPYAFLKRPTGGSPQSQPGVSGQREAGFGRVLVVGAGGGNDVAAALRNGVAQVDAVEIDPAILSLGRQFHAEQPYSDPRVTVHVDDARAFMRHAPDVQYDLIVFGLLDSHTLLSGMSAVRLDNFVYTLESLQDAKRLLKPQGALVLSFATGNQGFLATRLHNMLVEVFEQAPRCFELGYDDGLAFVVGSGIDDVSVSGGSLRETAVEVLPNVAAATDDWPFLYLQGPRWDELPHAYFVLVGLLALISVVWILAGSGRRTGISPHFFFLGGAFLLIEVKGITELALVFGTTWLVSSVVIASILALILLANLFVTVFPRQNVPILYALLAATLLAGYSVPVSRLLTYGWWTAAVGATTLLVLPLFFAGVIFATSLKKAASLPRAFASNLLGAILGGLCEYGAMAFGFRKLYLVGLLLYAASFILLPRRQAASERKRAVAEQSLPDATSGELL